MTNKTFREQYKDARRGLIINAFVVIFNVLNLRNVLLPDYSTEKIIGLVAMAIALPLGLWYLIYQCFEMKKAKRYIVFDDFLKPDQP